MKVRLPLICLVCLTLVMLSAILAPAEAAPDPSVGKKVAGPIRVLVPGPERAEGSVNERLKTLKFEVVVLPWDKLEPDGLKNIDVILLPTGWAGEPALYKQLESKKDQFHRFVKRGGGFLVCQPNPINPGTCTPQLLPYPITFQCSYDETDKTRVNLDPNHFITEDLPGDDMPFPHDSMTKVDGRYTVLAKQKSTGSPSLAVCAFGDGRVVVQTANETRQANIPFKDEILRRMVVWAAGRETVR